VNKTKKTNVRKVEGECLTEDTVLERIREFEAEKNRKKSSTKRRLDFSDDDGDDSNTEEPTPKQITKQKTIKCKKCRKTFHNEMISCENTGCSNWLCTETCLPKKYQMGAGFYCCKKCKAD
jgi:hypothetical protein